MVKTREPSGTQEWLVLRALLLTGAAAWEPAAELLLMTAARLQHVTRLIIPALEAGAVVLCDRFIGATLAYQGAGRGLSVADIMDLHARHAGGLLPDITVLLDVPPALGLSRSRRRLAGTGDDEGGFEALDLAFHERVQRSFLAKADEATIVINATAPIAEVHGAICERVRSRLQELL